MRSQDVHIRDARPEDAPALLAIYAPFVTDTPVSFELRAPSLEEFSERIARAQVEWAWLVAEAHGRVIGYAYGSQYRARPAYRFGAEVSVYLDPLAHGRGIGRALYDRLFEVLHAKGYCNLFAGIVVPNDASVGFHRSMGFQPVGVFHRAGWKFGRWHDVQWVERVLRDEPIEA